MKVAEETIDLLKRVDLLNKAQKFASKVADHNVRIVSEIEQLKLEAEVLRDEIKEYLKDMH